MGGINAIVCHFELQIAHACVEEAPPPSSGDIYHHYFSRLERAFVVTRLIPTGDGGGDGARLGLVHEAVAEARGGLLN